MAPPSATVATQPLGTRACLTRARTATIALRHLGRLPLSGERRTVASRALRHLAEACDAAGMADEAALAVAQSEAVEGDFRVEGLEVMARAWDAWVHALEVR